MHEEFNEYFNMVKKIKDDYIREKLNIPKNKILENYSLTVKKLNNAIYLPEMLRLTEDIKENNFNYFSNYWKTDEYHHYSHGYNLKNIIYRLAPYSELISRIRGKAIDNLLEDKEGELIKREKEPFINIDFKEYDLVQYNFFIELINESAFSDKFYNWVPFQLRCLCENLLYDIFLKSLDNSHKDLYYSPYQHRRRDFSQLISLLNILKDDEFKQYHTIDQDIITILKEIQKKGNLTVHEIIRQIDSNYIVNWQEKIDRVLKNLLVLFKKVQIAKIMIEDKNRISKIKNVLSIEIKDINKDKDQVVLPKIKRDMNKDLFVKLHAYLSKEVESTKGELITLIREIGKNNFNKFLNLDLIEGGKILQLINEDWELRIFGPTVLKPYSFYIRHPKLKENNIYRDNPDDQGNPEIHKQFLNYFSTRLGINELEKI